MAEAERPKFALGDRFQEANRLAKLLDPHLRPGSETGNGHGRERPYPRQTVLLVVGVSLVIWAAIFALIGIVPRL